MVQSPDTPIERFFCQNSTCPDHGKRRNGNDQDQLSPLLDAIQSHTGRQPKEISADAGYCSEANLEGLEGRGIRGYVATGRQRHGQAAATGRGRQQGPRVRAMRQRLGRGGFRSRDRFRKPIVDRCSVRSSRRGAFASSSCVA